MEPVLDIRKLNVVYQVEKPVIALKDVDLQIFPGETVGIVGESGCGKSTLAFSIMGYLHRLARHSGEICFNGTDLASLSRKELTVFRGSRLSMVFQNPFSSLNPAIRIGEQLAEVGIFHKTLKRKEAWEEGVEILDKLNIPDPELVVKRYPHQISGGMQQRVCIAMALLCEPDLLIMDEPTTALDVTTEVVILDMIRELKSTFHTSIVYITHDLRIVSTIADRVAVMYKGEVVETASRDKIFNAPRHPYTLGLLECVPGRGVTKGTQSLKTIPGYVKKRNEEDKSCPFRERCQRRTPGCEESYLFREAAPGHFCSCDMSGEPEPAGGNRMDEIETAAGPDWDNEVILQVKDFRHYYKAKKPIRAVDGVDFFLRKNHIIGIVGESGCGKSTTALTIQGLLSPTSGSITYRDKNLATSWKHRDRDTLREIQMVFQNPAKSLNPSFTVEQLLSRPLAVLEGQVDPAERKERIIDILNKVGLNSDYLRRKPGQMSGGELQRVAIARVFVVRPELVICDEPTSALDVSVQSAVLNLLINLQRESEISYLFISHDLHVVNYISDYVIVMYLGRICEFGRTEDIYSPPYHPYTEALLSAVPEMEQEVKGATIRLEGAVPSLTEEQKGCPFQNRCPRKIGEICETVPPPRVNVTGTHRFFCHHDPDELRQHQTGKEMIKNG